MTLTTIWRSLSLILLIIFIVGCKTTPEKAATEGFLLYDQGKYTEALPLLLKAYQGPDSDPELAVRLAFCLSSLNKDVPTAIQILQNAAIKYPRYARVYYQLGVIAYHHGDKAGQANLKQAVGFTQRAAQFDSTDFKIIDNLGMFHGMLGNLDSSLLWFERAMRINPDHAELKARIAEIRRLMAEKALADSLTAADTLRLDKGI